MSNLVRQLDSNQFSQEVLNADRPVLVDFYADWCSPCRILSPTIDALASDNAGRAIVAKVDIVANPSLAETYGVHSIPTLLLFKNGEVIEKFVGLQSKDDLALALQRATN